MNDESRTPRSADRLLNSETDGRTIVNADEMVERLRTVDPRELPDVLREVAAAVEHGRVQPAAVVQRAVPLLEHQRNTTRIAAARTLSMLASEHPDLVSAVTPVLREQLTDDSPAVRAATLRCFVAFIEHDPKTVTDTIGEIEPLVLDDVPYVGDVALEILRSLLPSHADSVLTTRETVVAAIGSPPELDPDDRKRWLRQHPTYREQIEAEGAVTSTRERYLRNAARVMASMAAVRPSLCVDDVSVISEVLSREASTEVRAYLLDALGAIAEHDPVAGSSAIDTVATVFDETDVSRVETKAVWTLCWLAEGRQGAVVTAVTGTTESLFAALDADDDERRGGALGLLSHIAEVEPEVVDPVLPSVRDRLSADSGSVRAAAVLTLWYSGTKADRERVRKLAAESTDPQVSSVLDGVDETIDGS